MVYYEAKNYVVGAIFKHDSNHNTELQQEVLLFSKFGRQY
jgi:hypothetical protein